MKPVIKHSPDDFLVEEVLSLDIKDSRDSYSIYKITKTGTNTLDVIADIAKRLRITRKCVSYGGLKDKKSVSVQYVSVPGGPKANYTAKNYSLEFVGWSPKPVSKNVLLGNKFSIVVRNIDANEMNALVKQMEFVKESGFVNYYDEQRFASARHNKGFFARSVILERWQEAFKLILVYPSDHDDQKTRLFRKCIQHNWNRWENCIPLATTQWEKRVLEYLSCHHKRFKNSLELVDKDLMFLLATAYQAFLWNRVAAEWIKQSLPKHRIASIKTKFGTLLFPKAEKKTDGKNYKYTDIEIPTLSPKMTIDEPWNSLYNRVLMEEGIPSKDKFRSKLRGLYFRSHRRKLFVYPNDFSHSFEKDEIFAGKMKLTINAFLPKGSFMTMMIKHIFAK